MVDIIVSLLLGVFSIVGGIGTGIIGSVWVLQGGSGVAAKVTLAIMKAKGF